MPQIVTWQRIEYRMFSVPVVIFVIPAEAGIHEVDTPPIMQCQHILRTSVKCPAGTPML